MILNTDTCELEFTSNITLQNDAAMSVETAPHSPRIGFSWTVNIITLEVSNQFGTD